MKKLIIFVTILLASPFWRDGSASAQTANEPGSGNSLLFNGSSDWVKNIGNTSSFSFVQNAGIFTIEAWIKSANPNSTSPAVICGNALKSCERGFFFRFSNNAGGLSKQLEFFAGDGMGNDVIYSLSPANLINDTQWHHVAVAGNATTITFYVDGIAYAGTGTMASFATGNADRVLSIGANTVDSVYAKAEFFNGVIDEMRIWNTTRTQSQIRDYMSSKLAGNEPGLVLYYRFDEGAGLTAFDQSINAYDGLIAATTIGSGSGCWNPKSNFGGGNRYGAVGFSIGSKGYLTAGYPPCGSDGGTWEYDPVTDVWTQKANNPTSNPYGGLGFSIGNKGYYTGGYSGCSCTGDGQFWEFDPIANTWTPKSSVPDGFGHIHSGLRFVINGKGYIGLGQNVACTGTMTANIWEYDPGTNTWTPKASFPGVARQGVTSFSINNKGYAVGGGTTDQVWEFDPISNSWLAKSNFPGGTIEAAVGFTIGNSGYSACGRINGISNTQQVWQYDPSTDTWTQICNFSGTGRTDTTHPTFVIGSKAFVGTGYNGSGLQDLWEYCPVK